MASDPRRTTSTSRCLATLTLRSSSSIVLTRRSIIAIASTRYPVVCSADQMLNVEQPLPPGAVHCELSRPVKKNARENRLAAQSGWPTASLPKIAGQSQLASHPAGSVMTCSGSSSRGAWTARSSTPSDPGERADPQRERLQDRDGPDHLEDEDLVVVGAVVVDEALDEVEDAEQRDQHRLDDVEDRGHLALERRERGDQRHRQELVHVNCPPWPSPVRAGAGGGSVVRASTARAARALTSARLASDPTLSAVSYRFPRALPLRMRTVSDQTPGHNADICRRCSEGGEN